MDLFWSHYYILQPDIFLRVVYQNQYRLCDLKVLLEARQLLSNLLFILQSTNNNSSSIKQFQSYNQRNQKVALSGLENRNQRAGAAAMNPAAFSEVATAGSYSGEGTDTNYHLLPQTQLSPLSTKVPCYIFRTNLDFQRAWNPHHKKL